MQLKEAGHLLSMYKTEPSYTPIKTHLRGNKQCKLALQALPEEVYEEWDIMIDAPCEYFPEALARMAEIFSVAVMVRQRKGFGVTHVFLHYVNQRVEKAYAEEFLCRKYLNKVVGRL